MLAKLISCLKFALRAYVPALKPLQRRQAEQAMQKDASATDGKLAKGN